MNFLNGLFNTFKYLIMLVFIAIINNAYNIKNIPILILEYTILTLIIIYMFYPLLREDLKKFKKNYKDMLISSLKIYIPFVVLMIVSNYILTKISGGIASNEQLNRDFLSSNIIYAMVSLIIFTPICEEIIFRLAYKDSFKNNVLNILVTAFIFAAMHIIGATKLIELVYIIPYFFLGLAFSLIYFKKKNIFPSITFHMFHNLICIIIIQVSL